MTIRRFARVRVPNEDHQLFGELIENIFEVRAIEHGESIHKKGDVLPLEGLELLPPVKPSKIVAVALNYRAHAVEMKKPIPEEPLFFFKPVSALLRPGGAIRLPPDSAEVHHEAELGIVIGKTLSNATTEEARDALSGLTCVNDVTARDIQRRQNHYTRAKGYDTFCPVGPFLVTGIDPTDLLVRAYVNGALKEGRTSDMIFGPYELISFVSKIMTLYPGDLISTGTPPGVGPLRAGDKVVVEIEGLGRLENTVAGAA
jgi:2-keto-4-pentenoate hydratase/2-oxohepta-3-ene-1,7-dioic acid hydratase in catechol pathway